MPGSCQGNLLDETAPNGNVKVSNFKDFWITYSVCVLVLMHRKPFYRAHRDVCLHGSDCVFVRRYPLGDPARFRPMTASIRRLFTMTEVSDSSDSEEDEDDESTSCDSAVTSMSEMSDEEEAQGER